MDLATYYGSLRRSERARLRNELGEYLRERGISRASDTYLRGVLNGRRQAPVGTRTAVAVCDYLLEHRGVRADPTDVRACFRGAA